MPFADPGFGVRAGGVEVAEDDRAKALVTVEILQYLLDDQLAPPVRVDRQLRVVLIHRNGRGDTIGRARRREHDLVDARRLRRTEQRYRAGDVVLIEASRIADRLGDFDRCGKMNDRVRSILRKNFIYPLAVSDISPFKWPPFDELSVPA